MVGVRVCVQVAEFKRLLGVLPTPKKEYLGVPVVSHDRSLKLPKEFDARTAWSQCTSIGRILGQSYLASIISVFLFHCSETTTYLLTLLISCVKSSPRPSH